MRFLLSLAMVCAVSFTLASGVRAEDKKAAAPAAKPVAMAKAPAGPKCPVCKMPLSAKKTVANAVPVKIGKKTYYCCSKCAMKKPKKG